jgi:NAD(P)-dependent dehydrogenase (short-subunit alcohol dehydrogenase family)
MNLLITGGSRGIGAATARLAAREGYTVAINYRAARDQAEALVAEIEREGGKAIAVQADVASGEQVEAMFRKVDELGPLDALVNSAGISMTANAADFEESALQRLLGINVLGTLLCCREAVRRMSTRLGGKGGAIVNVSSMAAEIGGRPGRTAYAASKGAVDSFTIGLAKEVGREGIRVNALRPGMTMTDMTDAVRSNPQLYAETADTIAMNRCAQPEEMARPILWLLSEEASFISGALLDGSGGGFMVGQTRSG